MDYQTSVNQSYTTGLNNIRLTWSRNNRCSGTATACNTYGTSLGCSSQAGCSWSGGVSYDTNRPTINPIAPQIVSTSSLSAWSYFTETATKNGGEIYYQLSSDGGINWQYWDGGAWATAGPTNYNTATVVNSNISSFTTSTGSFLFKAFLESNGTQLVQLDNVRIGWGEAVGGGSGFATFGYFMSSAYNMSPPAGGSPVQILNWSETNPGCSGCDVKMQLRVAPDSGGTPGTWGSWYGASGVDTYYTDPMAILLPTALNWKQWVQYRAELSGDGVSTPILSDVTVNYK